MMELIVVMAIASLITLASVPSFIGFTRTARLRHSAADISSALTSARRFAITRNLNYTVAIYCNDYVQDESLKNSFWYWETAENWDRKLLHPTVVIDSVTGGRAEPDGTVSFTFTPRGTAVQGGTITLRDASDKTVEVAVLGPTGRVRVGDLEE